MRVHNNITHTFMNACQGRDSEYSSDFKLVNFLYEPNTECPTSEKH